MYIFCKLFTLSLLLFFISCTSQSAEKKKTKEDVSQTKQHILALERKWIEAEFALDTAYIATLLDSTFISISANQVSNKQLEINAIYANMSSMRKDSIFLDSLKLEDGIVNLYGTTAVVTFITHSYKTEKRKPTEKRMRFYDVWINKNGNWKAISSQGTELQ